MQYAAQMKAGTFDIDMIATTFITLRDKKDILTELNINHGPNPSKAKLDVIISDFISSATSSVGNKRGAGTVDQSIFNSPKRPSLGRNNVNIACAMFEESNQFIVMNQNTSSRLQSLVLRSGESLTRNNMIYLVADGGNKFAIFRDRQVNDIDITLEQISIAVDDVFPTYILPLSCDFYALMNISINY